MRRNFGGAVLLGLITSMALAAGALRQGGTSAPLTLQETGLYTDFGTFEVDTRHLAFSPQYPLWTDGASKRRWMSLPPGATIDGSDPENWVFPVGTRFWKEFSFNGQRVETRYIELLVSGDWLYAAYGWNEGGSAAALVSERGRRGAYPLAGGRSHTIPSVSDCRVCHQAGRNVALGFSALQLSPNRDLGALHVEPDAPSRVDLDFLVENGLLTGFAVATTPRIEAASATERAALGYLHGNCGHCHDQPGKLENIGLFLRHVMGTSIAPGRASTVGQPISKAVPGLAAEALLRIEPGHPERSALMQRTASRNFALQMPPLGTELVDEEAVALITRWIAELDDVHEESNMEGRE